MKKLISGILLFLISAPLAAAVHIHMVQKDMVHADHIDIKDVKAAHAYFDELDGRRHAYEMDSKEDFKLFAFVFVPGAEEANTRFNMEIFELKDGKKIPFYSQMGDDVEWEEFFDDYAGNRFLKGPRFEDESVEKARPNDRHGKMVKAGKYRIEISNSNGNTGKYALSTGERKTIPVFELANNIQEAPELAKFMNKDPMEGLFGKMVIIIIILIVGLVAVSITALLMLVKLYKVRKERGKK